MADLVVFPGGRKQDGDAPPPDNEVVTEAAREVVVEALEYWLEKAKAGKVWQIAAVVEDVDGVSQFTTQTNPGLEMLGALRVLELDVAEQVREDTIRSK